MKVKANNVIRLYAVAIIREIMVLKADNLIMEQWKLTAHPHVKVPESRTGNREFIWSGLIERLSIFPFIISLVIFVLPGIHVPVNYKLLFLWPIRLEIWIAARHDAHKQ